MSARRSRTTIRIAAVLVAAAITVVTVASAAQITVNARDRHLDSLTPCTTNTLPTTATGTLTGGNFTHVLITSIPSGCNNLDVTLVVYGLSGTQLATSTGTNNTGTGGTATITTGSYSAASVVGVALLINTWGVHTSWVAPSSIFTCVGLNNGHQLGGGYTCDVTSYTISGPTGAPGSQRMDVTFTVGNNTGVYWRVTINFATGVFPWIPDWAGQPTPNLVEKYGGYTCPSPLSSLTVQNISSATLTATVAIGQSGATYPPTGFSKLCPP